MPAGSVEEVIDVDDDDDEQEEELVALVAVIGVGFASVREDIDARSRCGGVLLWEEVERVERRRRGEDGSFRRVAMFSNSKCRIERSTVDVDDIWGLEMGLKMHNWLQFLSNLMSKKIHTGGIAHQAIWVGKGYFLHE